MRNPNDELRTVIETAERRMITSRAVARARTAAEALGATSAQWQSISNFLDSRNVSLMTIPVDRVDERLRALARAALETFKD